MKAKSCSVVVTFTVNWNIYSIRRPSRNLVNDFLKISQAFRMSRFKCYHIYQHGCSKEYMYYLLLDGLTDKQKDKHTDRLRQMIEKWFTPRYPRWHTRDYNNLFWSQTTTATSWKVRKKYQHRNIWVIFFTRDVFL